MCVFFAGLSYRLSYGNSPQKARTKRFRTGIILRAGPPFRCRGIRERHAAGIYLNMLKYADFTERKG
jgi:hypothetical protein